MSLHTLANHLQQAGRGEDKVLVHMTPKEVNGLQTLAMAHGGSLSINPKTGLPEAGFLSSILPMIAGVALGPAGLGLSAMQAGLAAGAIGTVATGSLKKGLMAGLGAYGGAGMGAGLAGIGSAAAASALPAAAAAPTVGFAAPAMAAPSQAVAATAAPAVGFGAPAMTGALPGQPAAAAAAPSLPPPAPATNINVPATNTFTQRMKTIGQNVGKLFGSSDEDSEYRKQFFKQYRPEMVASGLSLLAYQPEMEREKERRRQFDPNYRAYSPGYFEDMYASSAAPSSTAERRYYAKNGGLMALANGGPVESMSHLNAIGADTHYPMANQTSSKYSMYEMPVPKNVVGVQGDSDVDPYTGELRMANGGLSSVPKESYRDPQWKAPTESERRAKAKGTEFFTPTYNYRDPITGQYKYVEPEAGFKPVAKIPEWSKEVKRITEDDINQVYNFFGVPVSEAAKQRFLGNRSSLNKIVEFVGKSPEFRTKKTWSPEEVTNYFQSVWGQPPTPAELSRFTAENKRFSTQDLSKYARKQPEFLQNLNKIGQQQFAQEKAGEAQEKRESSTLRPLDIASTFKDVLGRPPTYDELQSYKNKPMLIGDLKKQVEGSREFEEKLTKPLVPKLDFDQFGRGSIEGIPGYRTPEQKLGLEGFYDMMNRGLAQQGGYAAAPPAPPPMPDRLMPPPAPITYQPIDPVTGNPLPPAGMAPQVDPVTGLPVKKMAAGGISHLGDYSDGGRLLKGPGDGVSDSIPASIGDRQPARLADGEFVIPARIVSEIGNGSTDAGARKLYAMMDRIQKARRKSIGKGKVAVNSKADKYLPA